MKARNKHIVQHARYPKGQIYHSATSYRSFTVVFVLSVILLPTRLLPIIVCFSYIYFLQGSVATQFMCGAIFNNHFIANCPQNVPVK